MLLLVKLLIICLLIFSLIYGISNIKEHYFITGDWDNNKLNEYYKITLNNSYLRPSIILLIPIIGIFINRKIGWILIQSYFYFLISNLIFTLKYKDFTNITFAIFYLTSLSLILLIILIMNKEKISKFIYGIEKSKLIINNIIAFTIGTLITILLAMIKGNII